MLYETCKIKGIFLRVGLRTLEAPVVTLHTDLELSGMFRRSAWLAILLGRTPRGSCNRTLLRRVLRRFSDRKCFLEGFLEGACKGFQ